MNDLCLEFSNTVSWRTAANRHDHLHGYADLVEWAAGRELLSASSADALRQRSRAAPQRALEAFGRAVDLREAIYRIFSSVAAGSRPRPKDVGFLNGALSGAYSHLRIEADGERFRWEWVADPNSFDQIAWPVIWSAAELLTSGPLDRVKECAAEGCGWLFVDRSRNRSRRWCDMRDCGNRAKVRSYLERKKRQAAAKS